MSWRGYFALALLVQSGCALIFHQQCEPPPPHVNYVSSAPFRGTMDIVWSCLAILITCTWSIQHLAVPVHAAPSKIRRPNPWIAFAKELLMLFHLNQLEWMLLTILSPEFVLGKAVAEFLAAHHAKMQFDCPEWTLTHGYFANMRGLVLRFNIAAVPTSLTTQKPGPRSDTLNKPRNDADQPYQEQDVQTAQEIELQQCHEICGSPCRNRDYTIPTSTINPIGKSKTDDDEREGEGSPPSHIEHTAEAQDANSTEKQPGAEAQILEPASHSVSRDQIEKNRRPGDLMPTLHPHKPWVGAWALSSNQWSYAYKSGIITEPPQVEEEEIKDKSKGDALVKILAIGQVAWLVIQIIARAFQNLAVTLLEITVIAFAVCAIIIYLLLLHKPQDVEIPIYVDIPDLLTREQIIGLAARSPASSLIVNEFWLHGVAIRAMADNIFPTSPGLSIQLPWMKQRRLIRFNPVLLGIGFGGTIFGSVHFAAWNFEFPTTVERLLWRISTVLVTALPFLMCSLYWGTLRLGKSSRWNDVDIRRALIPLALLFIPAYILSRLFMIVETLRALAYPVPSVFATVDWSLLIPHIN